MDIYRQDQARLPATFRKMVKPPEAVVQPHDAQAVAAALRWCRDHGVAAVPRGAGSSAFGGSLATTPAITIDTRRLAAVREVQGDGTAWVEAGATWNRVMAKLRDAGRAVLVSTTSQFSTVGGMVATGGMGLGSTGHGSIRDTVEEVEVATPEGLETHPVADASHLFCTDGQLGIVTAVRLRTRPVPGHGATVVKQCPDYAAAIQQARGIARMEGIHTVLVYDAARVAELNRLIGRDLVPERDTVIARFESDTPVEAPASDVGPAAVGFLWQQRHFPMRPLKMGPGLLGAEILLPDRSVAGFTRRGRRALAAFGLHAANEAYILPGGQVLNITTFLTDAEAGAYTLHVAQVARLTRMAVKMGGTPYGGGLWNLPFMRHRHPDLRALRVMKAEVDPTGTVNPGKSLDPPPRRTRLGAMLRTPAATWGPALSGLVASTARYRPRDVRPDRRDVPHPGSNTVTPLHPDAGPAEGEADVDRAGAAVGPPRGDGPERAGPALPVVVDAHEYSHQACTQCAACVPVCPAWQHTGDDRTTARGKLQFMARLAVDPEAVEEDEAATLYQCIRCRACEEVCQTDLPLLPAFEALEGKLTERFGFPADRVRAFLESFEEDGEAQALIDETRGVFDETHALLRPGQDGPLPGRQPGGDEDARTPATIMRAGVAQPGGR